MSLYQEILFLQHFYKGKWVVENVKPYYEPLIKPTAVIGRHYFWANFKIPMINFEKQIGRMNGKKQDMSGKTQAELRTNNHKRLGFDLSKYSDIDKSKVLNNCVAPEIGLAILESAFNIYQSNKAKQWELL